MNIDQFKSKLKANGIELIVKDENLTFHPIKKSPTKYLIITLLSLPSFLIVIFFTGLSLIGLIVLGAGISCFYNGYKSRNEVLAFNASSFEITDSEVVLQETTIPLGKITNIMAGRSTNPLFPNISIKLIAENGAHEAIKISRKQSKYLNEDKYDIVNGLKELIMKPGN